MTEVQLKLQDAATQMRLALAHSTDEQIFRSCINSFVSAARSVTFVMQTESVHPELSAWYRETMSKIGGSPLFKFFNSQRVHSIHRGVIAPTAQAHPFKPTKVSQVRQPNGKFQVAIEGQIEADSRPADIGDVFTTLSDGTILMWTFKEIDQFRPGDTGNVIRLCDEYFLVLRWLVQEWLRQKLKFSS